MTTKASKPDSLQSTALPTANAALQGASLAFGKPPVKPKPNVNNYSGTNAALAAARGSHSRSASSSRLDASERLAHQRSGGSTASGYTVEVERPRPSRLASGNGSLQLPDQSKSPSFIAAALAASRSVTPNHTGQQLSSTASQRQANFTGKPSGSVRSLSSRESLNQALDTTPIPPTTSLISMFEQNASAKQQSVRKRPTIKRSITSATQVPDQFPESLEPPLPVRARTPSPRNAQPRKQKPEIKSPKPNLPKTFVRSPKPTESPKITTAFQPPSKPAEIPEPTTNRKPAAGPSKAIEPIKSASPTRKSAITASKPIPIPSKATTAKPIDDASSEDSFVSASEDPDYTPSFRATIAQNRRLNSPSIVSVDSLANAIVASSLASSRAASPSKSLQTTSLYPPPPPPRRNPRNHMFHNSKELSRTPSPAKGTQLRTTMRKPRLADDVDEREKRRARKNLMKKHPHKHHEGDRKRWRDELTERERKRYEAVWASNKGLYTSASFDGGAEVCNLVVRDIWNRSRLPEEVLEEVYALVDRKGGGSLGKEEFVVGLWLVDQRLKGRKLPIRVSESVWRSVGLLGGIKVKKAK